MLNGSKEFCQEFLDRRARARQRPGRRGRRRLDRRHPLDVPRADGAQLAARHRPRGRRAREGGGGAAMTAIARDAGRTRRPAGARSCIGEADMLELVGEALQRRIGQGITTGTMSDQSSAIGRLFAGSTHRRRNTIAFELAGSARRRVGRRRRCSSPSCGNDFLMRQVGTHRRRHDRDGRQRGQRTRARHAPRAARTTATSRSATSPRARPPSRR